jgi:hypothetical protein
MDFVLGLASAVFAVSIFYGAWIETYRGRCIPFLVPGVPVCDRNTAPVMFKLRLACILVSGSLFTFFALFGLGIIPNK